MIYGESKLRRMYRLWWYINLLHRFNQELALTYGLSEYDRAKLDRAAEREPEPDHCVEVHVPVHAVAAGDQT